MTHFPRSYRADNLIFLSATIAGGYSTTSQSFMLLPTREVRYLMMSLFYIAHIRKNYICSLGPLVNDNFIFVLIVTIAGEYSTTFQSFILLPTREDEELVFIQFYIEHIRGKNGFGPPATHEWKFLKILFRQLSS